MSPLLYQSETSSGTAKTSQSRTVDLTVGLLPAAIFGTSAGVRTALEFAPVSFLVTTGAVAHIDFLPMEDTVSTVRRLRDRILSRGLSRQDIARALGVDRRSLTGWASGAIRPAPERLHLLRILADLVDAVDAERPGCARDILLVRRGRGALLDRLTTSGEEVLRTWPLCLMHHDSTVTVTRRAGGPEPIWAAAAQAWAEGRLAPLERAGTARAESTYEMDPSEAGAFREPEYEAGRRRFS